jgi:hypothetical protein
MLHFITRDLDITLPVTLKDGALTDLQVQIAMSAQHRADGMSLDFVPLEVDGLRIAIRADELVCIYSEEEAGRITVRSTSNEKRMKVDRDRNGDIAGISPA